MTRRVFILIISIALSSIWISCQGENKKEVKALVYEGMSRQDLRNKLGEPISIDSSGHVFDTQRQKKVRLEKWEYDKRTVLIINDTVKDPNIN